MHLSHVFPSSSSGIMTPAGAISRIRRPAQFRREPLKLSGFKKPAPQNQSVTENAPLKRERSGVRNRLNYSPAIQVVAESFAFAVNRTLTTRASGPTSSIATVPRTDCRVSK